MILDLAALPDANRFDCDICIIGSGAAGLAVAREFFDTTVKVIVVESGGDRGESEANVLNKADCIGLPNSSLESGRIRGLGGTTELWPGGCIPLEAIDFSERPWVSFSGWPIARTDLDPYYDRAAALLRVPMDAFENGVASVAGVPVPGFDPDVLTHGMNLFSPRPHRNFGKLMRPALKRSANVDVLVHATASELHTNASGSVVERLDLRSLSGRTAQVRARYFVLCAGGFENPRLLLLSRGVETAGIGNRRDLVGRFFQDHPAGRIGEISTDEPKTLQRFYGVAFQGFPPRPRPYMKIHLAPALQRKERVLHGAATVVWDIDQQSGEEGVLRVFHALRALRAPLLPAAEMRKILRDLPGTASFMLRYLKGQASLTPPTSMWLLSMSEQAPNPESRVMLSDARDQLGMLRLTLDWRLTEMDRRTASAMSTAIHQELSRLRLARVQTPEWLSAGFDGWDRNFSGCFHPSGTTRMSRVPADGVVDAQCRVHGVPNLYIGGSSVFPTSGYANPTLTIVALAIRVADSLRSELRCAA